MNDYQFIFTGGINRTTSLKVTAATLLEAEDEADAYLHGTLKIVGSPRHPKVREWALYSVTKYYTK